MFSDWFGFVLVIFFSTSRRCSRNRPPSRLPENEISGCYGKVVPDSESFQSNLKFSIMI